MADLDEGKVLDYKLKLSGNGIYVFILEGKVKINGEVLNTRDGLALKDLDSLDLEALATSSILLMEVPA